MEKTLKDFDYKYSVTEKGVVYSLKGHKKALIGKVTRHGYREVVISHKNKKKYILVHRLVAQSFLENKYNLRTVNHKDGNKLNNCVENLEWMSDRDNLIHARDNGMLRTKITKDIANKIRSDKGSIRYLSIKYGLGKTQISYIKQGKRWMD